MNRMRQLPVMFLKARLRLINDELEAISYINTGVHREQPIIREYRVENGIKRKHEYKLANMKGQMLLKRLEHRNSLSDAKRLIESCITDSAATATFEPSKVTTIFNKELYESLQSEALEVPANLGYIHNGIRMRSRGEVVIAQVLDSLGLEYKYETEINIDGETYYPDFSVYLPEFERFFIIEFLGMLDDKTYAIKNSLKLGTYLNAGMIINTDLLIFEGTKNTMPSVDSITEDIIALIKKYCRIYSI